MSRAFIAIGNAKTSLFLAIYRKIILLIPFIYILPRFFEKKDMAVFLAEPVADFVVRIIDVADNAESEMQVRSVIATKCQITQEDVTKITLKTPDVAHTFMAGHRIKVLLHSTWGNKLKSTLNSKCDITLLHDKSHPSHVSFQLQ